MHSNTTLSLLAIAALVCVQCAPSSTRHTGRITKPVGANGKRPAMIIDPKTGKMIPNPAASPSPSPSPGAAGTGAVANSCANGSESKDSAAVAKIITDIVNGPRYDKLETLPSGRYTLTNVISNYEIQDNNNSDYESVIRFNVTSTASGAKLNCADNQFAGQTPIPPDGGREIMVEGVFDLDTNKKVQNVSIKMDLRQRTDKGAKYPVTEFIDSKSKPPQTSSPSDHGIFTLIQQIAGNPAYDIAALNGVKEVVQVAQVGSNNVLVYIDVVENNGMNSHRQIALIYTVDQTSGTPTPQPSPGQ